MQNAFVESLSGKLRDECLNLHWFRSLRHAREEIERWRHHYNTERTHSALGYRTPMEILTTNAATALDPLEGSALPLIAQFQPEIPVQCGPNRRERSRPSGCEPDTHPLLRPSSGNPCRPPEPHPPPAAAHRGSPGQWPARAASAAALGSCRPASPFSRASSSIVPHTPASSIFRHRNARASALTIALSTRGRGAYGAPSGVTTSFRPRGSAAHSSSLARSSGSGKAHISVRPKR